MRRVLCLFHYFPPMGGAGAIRCAGLVHAMHALGWRSVVVAPRASARHHTPGEDLLGWIPPGTEVVRTEAPDLRKAFSPLRRLGIGVAAPARALGCGPDERWGWLPFALLGAGEALRAGPVDALLTYGAPWSAHLAGLRIARRASLPWVAAFADPWSTSDEVRWATPLHRRWARHWEGRVLARADAVAPVTDAVGEALAAAHPGLRPRFETVRNGFDELAFDGRIPARDARFTLVHAGTAYAGSSPAPAIRMLAAALASRPALRDRVRFRVLGEADGSLAAEAARLGLAAQVSLEGPRPLGEAVQALLDAHVAACVFEREGHAAARPLKLLYALRAGPPVLGVFPEGEASRLLARFPDCRWIRPGDLEAGARALGGWLDAWADGSFPEPGFREGIEDLSRSAEAARLVRLLERLTG